MASGKTWNRRLALAGGAALAAAAGALALRGPGNGVHRAMPGQTVLRRGNAGEPQTLDPNLSSGVQEFEIIADLVMGLMTSDAQGRAIPGMATHWESTADGLTWTFHLREALWSDGVPVTAEDFVFAWRRILDPATASSYSYFLYVVKNGAAVNARKLPPEALGIKALDDHTLEIHLEHPAPYLLEMLVHTATMPLPRHIVSVKGRAWAQAGNYVGNGAFVLKQWVPNDHILVEKNPLFFDAAHVALEQVYFFPTDDYSAALQRFRAGELDFQDRFPIQQIDWIKANLPQTIAPVPQLIADIVAVNFKRPPFGDIRVREAINLALNREALTERIVRVGYVPAYNLVPPGTANYPGGVAFDFQAMTPRARLDKARALMRQAGHDEKNPVKTTYLIRSTAPGAERAAAAAIQQMLAQIFIDISILPADMQVFYPQIQAHDFDICKSGWVADFNDASTFLNLLQTGGGDNWGEYSNPAFDAALAEAQADTNLVSRGHKLAAAESIALKDHALMPLWFWVSENITWPYVKNWEPNALDYHRSRWVTIDQAARLKQFA